MKSVFTSSTFVLGLGMLLAATGCGKPEASSDGNATAGGPKQPVVAPSEMTPKNNGEGSTASTPPDKRDAMQVLRDMEATYKKAKSYADAGQVVLRFTRDGQPLEEAFNFAVAFERPNKLRMLAYDAIVVSDGQKFNASIASVPNTVLQIPAPATLTLDEITRDFNLRAALVQGPGGPPVQLAFLMAETPVQELLRDVLQPPKLLQPEPLDGIRCNRVELDNPDGPLTLWIDAQANLIRRIDLPTRAFKKVLEEQGPVSDLSLTIDLREAQVDRPIDAVAFKFEIPEGTRLADSLVQDLAPAKIAERTEPAKLKLTKLWTADSLGEPANLLVLPGPDGTPRIYAIDGWRTVVELDSAGKTIARHELALPETAIISYLRTTTDAAGKRYFVAGGNAQPQLHLFDENWKPLLSFPKPEDGGDLSIGDVQLVDLTGSGTPLLAVGYWGDVGLQGVGLDGNRQWRDRSLQFVLSLATTDADAEGHRRLLATHSRGSIVPFNFEGKPEKEIVIPNRHLHTIHAADLTTGQPRSYCALAGSAMEDNIAVGVDLSGKELWNYVLPQGVHSRPIEMLTTGDVTGDGAREWILAGADGSVHIVGADGVPLDKFNTGHTLTGLAAAQLDGKPVLLISSLSTKEKPADATPADAASTDAAPSTPKGRLEAWVVEKPAE